MRPFAVTVLPRQTAAGRHRAPALSAAVGRRSSCGGAVAAAVRVHPGDKMHVLRPPLVEAAVARHSSAPAAHFNERVTLGGARFPRDHLLLQGGRGRGAGRVGGGRGGRRWRIQVFREAVPRQGGVVETLRVRVRPAAVVLVALVAGVVLVGAGLAVMVVMVGGGRGSGEQGGRGSGGEDLNAAGP